VLTSIHKINIETLRAREEEGKKSFPGNSMKWHFIQFNFMLCNYFVQNVRYYIYTIYTVGTTTTVATTNQVESMKHSSVQNGEWFSWKRGRLNVKVEYVTGPENC